MTQATIVAGGYHWLHAGIRTIDAATDEMLAAARRDLVLTIYRLHDWKRFAVRMRSVLGRGVRVTVIIDRWADQPEASRRAMLDLVAQHPSLLRLYGFRDPDGRGVLHAKAVAADSAVAIVGEGVPGSVEIWRSSARRILRHRHLGPLRSPCSKRLAQLRQRAIATHTTQPRLHVQ